MRVAGAIDSLEASGTIDVGHGGYLPAALGADGYNLQHERHVVIADEPVGHRLTQYRGCKGTERFAALDLQIKNILHIRASWVAEYRAIAKRPRSPLHAALEPADDQTFGNCLGCCLNQFL